MTAQKSLAQILGVDSAVADKVAPLLADAAGALADVTVPSEAELHDMASGAYRYTQSQSLESEDTDRRFEEAMKNVSKWREHAQVYLNGAAVLLRRMAPALSRYEAKKRVLAALRAHHPSRASERFYFTRETAADIPAADLKDAPPLAPPPEKGRAFLSHAAFAALLAAPPDALTAEQRGLLVRTLAIAQDPRSQEATRVVEKLVACGDRIGPTLLAAMSRPAEAAKSVDGEAGELLIGIRRVLPRLGDAWAERVLRAAVEAGWLEWLDRPLLDPPLPAALREKLLREFGTRQEAAGNPYRPSEAWFYNLDPS